MESVELLLVLGAKVNISIIIGIVVDVFPKLFALVVLVGFE